MRPWPPIHAPEAPLGKLKILLVTPVDEAYRKPLLESEGYEVQIAATLVSARRALAKDGYELVLVVGDSSTEEMLAFCLDAKKFSPRTRTAVLAQWAEYVPKHPAVDAVIRIHHSPREFLAAVRMLVEAAGQ